MFDYAQNMIDYQIIPILLQAQSTEYPQNAHTTQLDNAD